METKTTLLLSKIKVSKDISVEQYYQSLCSSYQQVDVLDRDCRCCVLVARSVLHGGDYSKQSLLGDSENVI